MPTTTAEATTVLADEPVTTPGRTVPARPAPTAPTTAARLDPTATAPTSRVPAPVSPSAETPVDRLTRRTLGALRRQSGRVLVTGRTDVPTVVARRLAQRDPALAARTTCEDIFALAQRVLDERQIEVSTDQPLVDAAWDAAWERVGRHTVLCDLDEAARWRAEIAGAIKGRGLIRFSQYSPEPLPNQRSSLPGGPASPAVLHTSTPPPPGTSRTGAPAAVRSLARRPRHHAEPLASAPPPPGASRTEDSDSASHLAAVVWDLYVAYSEELAVRFAHDRADMIAIALDELTVNPSRNRFSVVVLDPTLPLSPTMIRLLRAVTITR